MPGDIGDPDYWSSQNWNKDNFNPLPSEWPEVNPPDFSSWTKPPDLKSLDSWETWKSCLPKLPKISLNLVLPTLPIPPVPKIWFPGLAIALMNIPGIPALPEIPALPDLSLSLNLDVIPDISLWEQGALDITGLKFPGWDFIPDCLRDGGEEGSGGEEE